MYLRDARTRGADPVLCVYVDSNARLTDFRANKDVYLARLSNVGLAVSDVEFRLSRTRKPLCGEADAHARQEERSAPGEHVPSAPLPALTAHEEEHVSRLVRDLPAGLRESASRAISLSMRRKKIANTQKGKKRA